MSTNWITLSQTAGTGNQVVTVSAVTNEVMSERQLRIKITTGGKTEYVFVTQDAAPLMVTRIEFTGCQFPPISYTGGTLTTSDGRYNITAYYNDGSVVPQVAATVTGNSFSSSAINASLSVVSAGTMNLTASFSGKSASTTYTVMQMGVPEGCYIEYSGNSQVNVSGNWSSTGTTNVIANSYSGGSGLIVFDNVADYIPTEAFANQTNLTGVIIPSNIEGISSNVFSGCSSLTSIEYDGTIDEFEDITKDSAWRDGSSIEYVQCTDGIIDYYFDYIYIASAQPFYISYSGGTVNPISGEYVVKGVYYDGTEDIIDNSEIVFSGSPVTINTVNTATTTTLASAVTITASYSGVSATTVLTATTNVPVMQYNAPETNILVYSATTQMIPRSVKSSDWGANIIASGYNESNGIGTIVFDGNITGLKNNEGSSGEGMHLFTNNNELLSIDIPSTVTTIGAVAFDSCYNLVSVNGLENRASINFNNRYPNGAFRGCRSLIHIGLPAIVTSSGWSTNDNLPAFLFYNCKSLETIQYAGTMSQFNALIKSNTWYTSSALKYVECSDGTIDLYYNRVITYYAPSEVGWTTDNNSGGIHKNNFAPKLITGDINPWSVFKDGVGNLIFTSEVAYVGEKAFFKCTTITAIELTPTSFQSIGESAFSICTSLSSITIPNNVINIGRYAFWGCTSLQAITYQGTMAQWNNINLGSYWKDSSAISVIHCTDGDISV